MNAMDSRPNRPTVPVPDTPHWAKHLLLGNNGSRSTHTLVRALLSQEQTETRLTRTHTQNHEPTPTPLNGTGAHVPVTVVLASCHLSVCRQPLPATTTTTATLIAASMGQVQATQSHVGTCWRNAPLAHVQQGNLPVKPWRRSACKIAGQEGQALRRQPLPRCTSPAPHECTTCEQQQCAEGSSTQVQAALVHLPTQARARGRVGLHIATFLDQCVA